MPDNQSPKESENDLSENKPSTKPKPTQHISLQEIDFQSPHLSCLAIISRLLGKPVSTAKLKAGIPQKEEGTTAKTVILAAQQAGIIAKLVNKNKIAKINKLVMPCMLILNNGNACVLTEIEGDNARVIFPEQGNQEQFINITDLEEEYTGYVIFCKCSSKLDSRVERLKFINTKRWFWGVIFKFWRIYQHVIIASILTNLIVIAAPLFVMNVYDRVIPNNAIDTLWALTIGIGIAYLLDFLLKNMRGYFVDLAGRKADIVIGSKIMQHLMQARLDHMPESAGVVANNVREFESLRDFFSSSSLVAIIDLPFLVAFICLIYYIGGPIAYPLFVAVPLVIIVGLFLQVPLQYILEKHYKESTQKNALLFEIVHGLQTIKTSMAEGRMQEKWEHVVGQSALSSSRSKMMANVSITFSMLSTQLVSIFVIVIGVFQISKGELSMGGLIACNLLSGRAMAPLSAVAGLLARFQQSRMALQALDMLMQMPSERPEGQETFDYDNLDSTIVFEETSFAYPGTDRAVLSGLRLTIKPGEKIGIIGRTGAGKSTLGKLCVGLYQPVEGSVQVGGIDLRQLDVADLRRKIGYISQDSLLFFGSLRENIAFGLPEADDYSIKMAADIAGVSEFAKRHPAGYGMGVGERGSSLSGGQRQAVTVARAILPDPDVLIMDEPSSNMDKHSEKLLKHHLSTYLKKKSVILITHRHSMLDLVDRIIIMEQGRIVVDGPKEKVFNALKSGKIKVPV